MGLLPVIQADPLQKSQFHLVEEVEAWRQRLALETQMKGSLADSRQPGRHGKPSPRGQHLIFSHGGHPSASRARTSEGLHMPRPAFAAKVRGGASVPRHGFPKRSFLFFCWCSRRTPAALRGMHHGQATRRASISRSTFIHLKATKSSLGCQRSSLYSTRPSLCVAALTFNRCVLLFVRASDAICRHRCRWHRAPQCK